MNYRPPDNRRPSENEIKRYLPYLVKHIEIIDPKILVLLGSTALNALIGDEEVISKVRGKWIEKKIGSCKTSVIVTFHPAFLMRQPAQKKMAWIDLKMIKDKKNLLGTPETNRRGLRTRNALKALTSNPSISRVDKIVLTTLLGKRKQK